MAGFINRFKTGASTFANRFRRSPTPASQSVSTPRFTNTIKKPFTNASAWASRKKSEFNANRQTSKSKSANKQVLFKAERNAKMAFNRNSKSSSLRQEYINAHAAANKVRTRTNRLKRATFGKYQTYRNNKQADRNYTKETAKKKALSTFHEGDEVMVTRSNGQQETIKIIDIIDRTDNWVIGYMDTYGSRKEETFKKSDVSHTPEMMEIITRNFNKSFGQKLSNKAKAVALTLNPLSSQNDLNYKESKVCKPYKEEADKIISNGFVENLDFKYVTNRESGKRMFVIKQIPIAKNRSRDISRPIKIFSGDSLNEALGKLNECNDGIKLVRNERIGKEKLATTYKKAYNNAKNTTRKQINMNRSNANTNIQIQDLIVKLDAKKEKIVEASRTYESSKQARDNYENKKYRLQGKNYVESSNGGQTMAQLQKVRNSKGLGERATEFFTQGFGTLKTRHTAELTKLKGMVKINRTMLKNDLYEFKKLFDKLKKLPIKGKDYENKYEEYYTYHNEVSDTLEQANSSIENQETPPLQHDAILPSYTQIQSDAKPPSYTEFSNPIPPSGAAPQSNLNATKLNTLNPDLLPPYEN